jgi:PAS domain S-box-containing protein
VLALAWERKQAEEALRHEREVLNLALLTGQMGVYDLDLAHERLWWSPETYALFGVPAESFTPTRESFMALVHPQDRAALCRQFNDIIERQEPFNYEFCIIRADGALRWIANRGQTEYDADGRPVRHLGIALDITERKSMEEIAQRWQRLFEESFFGLAHEDARSNSFVAVNRAFAEHRGYTVEELTGKPALTIYPVELRDQMSQSIRGADNHGHALFETVHQRKDGTTFPVLLEVTSIKDRAGQAHSRVAYALDISRLKTATLGLQHEPVASCRQADCRRRTVAYGGGETRLHLPRDRILREDLERHRGRRTCCLIRHGERCRINASPIGQADPPHREDRPPGPPDPHRRGGRARHASQNDARRGHVPQVEGVRRPRSSTYGSEATVTRGRISCQSQNFTQPAAGRRRPHESS